MKRKIRSNEALASAGREQLSKMKQTVRAVPGKRASGGGGITEIN